MDNDRDTTDPGWFRRVLGQYPTGVCVVTAKALDGEPTGMVVGSFTSASLAPPMVAFLPARSSTTWPKIAGTGRFCVNILSADQEHICRHFSSKSADRFSSAGIRLSTNGLPIIDGCVASIDCDIHSVSEAGDHYIVLGAVRELRLENGGLPLLFYQGGYGRFSPRSFVPSETVGLISNQLRQVDLARPAMERLAADSNALCLALVVVGNELVIAASAGNAQPNAYPSLVGQRMPFMPPIGAIFVAWSDEEKRAQWLGRSSKGRDAHERSLRLVEQRGFSVGFISEPQRLFFQALCRRAQQGPAADANLEHLIETLQYDPPQPPVDLLKRIWRISCPVFGPDGNVALGITLCDVPDGSFDARQLIVAVRETARSITEKVGAAWPHSELT